MICEIGCPSAVAGGPRVVMGVAFDGKPGIGDEFTACPKTTGAERSNVIGNIGIYLQMLELKQTISF
jgi:hypothetical protein